MPSSAFNKTTTGTEVAEALRDDIRGKHVLVTGTSPGSIGEAAALAIARAQPAVLILASRTPAKLEDVARRVREEATRTKVVAVVLDLASLASVRQAAEEIAHVTPRLDVLINNAGISVHERRFSPEGIELTFATNHLGPFLLTNLLLPLLRKGASGGSGVRVVNVSSSGHRISPVRFRDYNFEGRNVPTDQLPRKGLPDWVTETVDGFPGMVAYGMSKTANVLFSVGLKRRLGIQSFAVDPGIIRTGLMRDIGPGFRQQIAVTPPSLWKSHDQGCATLLVAAFDPSLSEIDDVYLKDCQVSRPASYACDVSNAERLWSLSEQLSKLAVQPNKL